MVSRSCWASQPPRRTGSVMQCKRQELLAAYLEWSRATSECEQQLELHRQWLETVDRRKMVDERGAVGSLPAFPKDAPEPV